MLSQIMETNRVIKNARGDGDRRCLKLAFLVAVALMACHAADAASNLLSNGNMEEPGPKPNRIAGWSDWLWEGDAQLSQTTEAAFEGRRSALLQGFGPAKIAIFQKVDLAPCSYRLTAAVAGVDLTPGIYNQSAMLHIAMESGQAITHQILSGNSGWRVLNLEFTVPTQASATIYFFNYGSGYFFVDDVSLVAIDGCPARTTTFKLSSSPVAPLNFQPPPTAGDTLLASYCTDAAFAQRDVCRRLASADLSKLAPVKGSKPILMLSDFEGRQSPFGGGWSYERTIAGGWSARLSAGRYMDATTSDGLPSDWRGYDWLRFDVENNSAAVQRVDVEIRDTMTTDYWSRVNWTTSVPPGRSTVDVPLQSFVGEKSVIRERRRLDLEHVTHAIISAAEARVDLLIDNVRLEEEPAYQNDFPKLIKLDPGPRTGPVMTGFYPLYSSMTYSSMRGYGLSPDAQVGQVEDRRHPDNLFRDWISFRKGGLDIDLPNGRYHVWMMLEDPGYWEYFPNFTARKISVEGNTTVERQSGAEFLAKYLRHADDEDWPGEDTWQRYIGTRYLPHEFDVDVNDGQLNIRFDSAGDPHALPLSALVIYPDAEAKRGRAFLKELMQRLKTQFDREYKQVVPPPPPYAKPPANALDGSLWVFQRSIWRDVEATEWPAASELVNSLSLSMAQKEHKILPISLHSGAKLRLTGVELRLPGLDVSVSKVRYKLMRRSEDGSVYANVPRLLDPLAVSEQQPLDLPEGRSRTIWLELFAPETVSGTLKGELRLSLAGGMIHSMPVTIEVYPWTLPDVDVPVGYLGTSMSYPGMHFPEVRARADREVEQSLKLLHDHGMTMISGGPGYVQFLGFAFGNAKVDFSQIDSFVLKSQRYFRGEAGTYGGLGISGLPSSEAEARSRYGRSYEELLRGTLQAISEHGVAAGWPHFIYSIGDEPDDGGVQEVLDRAAFFKRASTSSRTMVFTSIRNVRGDSRLKFAGQISRIYLNVHSKDALDYIMKNGSECALYNQGGRYRRGVYLFKLSKYGCKGYLQFAFNSIHADPWYDLDGRESDLVAAFPHPDGRLRRTVDLVRYAEALGDYRYLLKLDQSIGQASAGREKSDAQHWLKQTLDQIGIGSTERDAWTADEIEAIRRQAAKHVTALRIVTNQ